MLKMKSCCERCQTSLAATSEAYICSYECTFCQTCTDAMNKVCPNCRGELVRRPTRERGPAAVIGDRLMNAFRGRGAE